MIESWINGTQSRRRISPTYGDLNEEYYGGQQAGSDDVEMKDVEHGIQSEVVDEYGDVDYRQHIDNFDEPKRPRRRSASPLDSFGTMAKRPRHDSSDESMYPPPARRGPAKNVWMTKIMCKFFR